VFFSWHAIVTTSNEASLDFSSKPFISFCSFVRRFCSDVSDEEKLERERFLNECIEDPTLRDRLSILTRTFANRRNLVNDDPLLFHDDVFTLQPLVGRLFCVKALKRNEYFIF